MMQADQAGHIALCALLSTVVAVVLASCGEDTVPRHLQGAGGDASNGRRLIASYGCGACHAIEGIPGARGKVGPSLHDYAARTLLAGILPNTPRTLVAWLMDPVAIEPRTGMPAMGVSEGEARDMAAYLHTLGASRSVVYPPDTPRPVRTILPADFPVRGQPPDPHVRKDGVSDPGRR